MLVNAGIKSKKELAQRLIDGEEFFTDTLRVYFDEKETCPFRLGDDNLFGAWGNYANMCKETNWWDNIPEEGVLCWVGCSSSSTKKVAKIIIKVFLNNSILEYKDTTDVIWTYATPVLPEECLHHE